MPCGTSVSKSNKHKEGEYVPLLPIRVIDLKHRSGQVVIDRHVPEAADRRIWRHARVIGLGTVSGLPSDSHAPMPYCDQAPAGGFTIAGVLLGASTGA